MKTTSCKHCSACRRREAREKLAQQRGAAVPKVIRKPEVKEPEICQPQ